MLIAKCTRRSEIDRERIVEEEREFTNIEDLEHFIGYYRAYIIALSFEGQLGTESEEE